MSRSAGDQVTVWRTEDKNNLHASIWLSWTRSRDVKREQRSTLPALPNRQDRTSQKQIFQGDLSGWMVTGTEIYCEGVWEEKEKEDQILHTACCFFQKRMGWSTNQSILEVHPREALFLLKSDAGVGGMWRERGRREGRREAGRGMGRKMVHLLKCLPSRMTEVPCPEFRFKKKKAWHGDPFI